MFRLDFFPCKQRIRPRHTAQPPVFLMDFRFGADFQFFEQYRLRNSANRNHDIINLYNKHTGSFPRSGFKQKKRAKWEIAFFVCKQIRFVRMGYRVCVAFASDRGRGKRVYIFSILSKKIYIVKSEGDIF